MIRSLAMLTVEMLSGVKVLLSSEKVAKGVLFIALEHMKKHRNTIEYFELDYDIYANDYFHRHKKDPNRKIIEKAKNISLAYQWIKTSSDTTFFKITDQGLKKAIALTNKRELAWKKMRDLAFASFFSFLANVFSKFIFTAVTFK